MYRIEDAITYIHTLGRAVGTPGLHRIRALLQAVGNPQKQLQFVHIAGTNGKGSTATMTAEILQCAGYRTGLFTSPYLVTFHERIRINGVNISDSDLLRLTQTVAQAMSQLVLVTGEAIGAFEFVIAISLLYFQEAACDIVVLETGMGGAVDATNVIDPPLVAAITSISYDHTEQLGQTIEQIARAKAGIIKRGSTLVCAPHQNPIVQKILQDSCFVCGVPCIVPQSAEILSCNLTGTKIQYAGGQYHIGMLGRHQADNASTALHIAWILRKKGFSITDTAISKGLQDAKISGRLECIQKEPLILLDGAHNPDGVAMLCSTIRDLIADKKLYLVLGMVRDKAVEPCVQMLASKAVAVYAAAPDNPRAFDAAALENLAAATCPVVYNCNTVDCALQTALAQADSEACILVCGSLYLVGEAKKVLESRHKIAK